MSSRTCGADSGNWLDAASSVQPGALVVRDITGVTGLGILRDIVVGHRDSQHLAEHRDYRCRASTADAALTGNYQPESLFVLQQNLELFDACQSS